jgi:hypothetical protein
MTNEPAVTTGTITAIVTALIAVLVAFGLPLTSDQQDAILGLIAVAAPLVAAVIIRPKVTPNSKVISANKEAQK